MGGIADLVNSAAIIGFNAAGDAIKTVYYTVKGPMDYDPTSNDLNQTDGKPKEVRMLIQSADKVAKGDPKIVSAAFNGKLTGMVIISELGFLPKTGDEVYYEELGKTLEVVGSAPADPVGATYNLLLEEPT